MLKNGDLLFVRAYNNQFEKMIADSTSQYHNYTHVGIFIDDNVIHANPKNGCVKQPLDEFINAQKAPINIFRIMNKQINLNFIKKRAESMIGLPYNHSFLQTDRGLYCSELITETFKDYHIFQLKPLNFGSNRQIKYWKKYYEKLGLSLPKNELGSSPNSLLDNNQLRFIQKIKK
ncbi:YiiX/YebB-like N1pC/P60 family cysteine hydrolase [Apilactobacillus micheneri]|uniref:YiiX/YebB-like N1pC/P60 family cysteine hydrolase n=1 Tax=Apilactobacillus micheneri TaxID=1899430 RepID=UPI0015E874D7|nr:YiiX/YebB-like N1pC/P60 family cysteine hydrolase [Apilactobacillus micheneri]